MAERDPMSKSAAAEPETPNPRTRTSVSGVVLPEEQVSASKTIALADVPSRALDRLLVLEHDLPISQGESGVIQAFVESFALLVPGHAVAVVVGKEAYRSEINRDSFAPTSGEMETSKLFANLVERVVRIAGSDATIILAADDSALADDSAPAVQLAHRGLFVLESARSRARMQHEVDELRAMLVQADKLAALGQLAAGMVHEINNPLTSILAYADFLSKRASAREDPDDVERLRRIGESAHRMLRLSRDIVSYARPSSETPQPVVISSVIEQALVFCDHLFQEAGVAVERAFGDGILPVRGRPEQLAQVFVNLFTNACHAMPHKGGRLQIATELTTNEGHVRIVVSDNGHGIDEPHIERVFLPFFTTKDEKHGTGLGLAIVKRIVDSHDGRVEVESDGGGTRFVIHLPVAGA
jgi:two-component system NtrC family sensor kinase